jgi:hypothetical protein
MWTTTAPSSYGCFTRVNVAAGVRAGATEVAEWLRSGTGSDGRQDKGEGRMAPKCARLLSYARPSVSADAISHLGARAV